MTKKEDKSERKRRKEEKKHNKKRKDGWYERGRSIRTMALFVRR